MPTLIEFVSGLATAVQERESAQVDLESAKIAYQEAARTYQEKVDAVELIQSTIDEFTEEP